MRWLVFAAWLGAAGVAHAGVAVVGLSGDATFSTAPGTWRHTFVAHMDGAQEKLPALSVSITDFQSDSGKRAQPVRPIATALFGGTADQHDAAAFTISVEVPEPDVYIATVVVSGGDRPLVRQLTLHVGPAAAPTTAVPAAVVGPSGVEAVGDQATLELAIRNVSSVEHTFTVAPSVMRKRGERLVHVDLVPRASVVLPSGPSPDGTLHLAGGADGRVQLEIRDAPPGEYAVELQLGEPGLLPTKLPGVVFIKRGILGAIALIAIGVLLAFGIARTRDVWLDSQGQRINLGRAMERLVKLEPSGDAARDALRELRQQAQDLDRAITDRKDCRERIENLGRRAVVFVRANDLAAEIADLDDGRREELRRKLDEVFRLVALPTGDTTAADKLSEIEDKDAERKALEAAIDAFAGTIDDHRLEADEAFIAQLGELAGRIQHLRELYKHDELAAAQQELAQLRDLRDKHGRDAIQRACDRVPVWTSEASWAQAMAGIKVLLASPGTSYDAVRKAFIDAKVALTVKETKHPDAPKLAAAQDMPSKLQLMAKIHAESGPEDKSISLDVRLFTAPTGAPAPRAKLERRPPEPFEWRTLQRRSKRVEALVLGVVMVLAVGAGLKALWIDNPTWGSWGDVLGALLWGSGVQVGAEAFVGLGALRAALGRRA